MALSYFAKHFQIKRRNIHYYDIRNKNKLVTDKVKVESTKRSFFYKGADLFNDCVSIWFQSFFSFYLYILRFLR